MPCAALSTPLKLLHLSDTHLLARDKAKQRFIRRITDAETALVHPNTIDVWVVLDGAGTITTGGRIEKGKDFLAYIDPIAVAGWPGAGRSSSRRTATRATSSCCANARKE